ncbi:rhodanese-like domain-containing protein [Alkalibacterium putridalgicola]|jgi:rhodanese-related sulfurtransferase|uniref:Rhodanese-like domain-containing protein n=1 Tax=Alkalibacterium putridalgicola TaxID=426703 RepID=A0A1H7W1Y9_9LACT|nr:rhodanese-like domain-containing protein [Alkalibacterium putridalgicola]GEK88670.1 rhodanese-like domain-containing protein [Alkalibacterium putridalgicola]SEM15027.1 Rhodanese-related sulfurtransferase [Alkalibacterium putridalgicola]
MYNSISMDEFGQKQRKEDINIIDVRETGEFASGHIPGAVNVPLSEFAQHLDKIDKDKDYYVLCLSGARSSVACDFLGNNGYTVTNVMGGMSAWRGDIE